MPVRSTVIIQRDFQVWTNGIIVSQGNVNHNDHSYKIQLTKKGHIIIRNIWHVKRTPITAEQYILKQAKGRKT